MLKVSIYILCSLLLVLVGGWVIQSQQLIPLPPSALAPAISILPPSDAAPISLPPVTLERIFEADHSWTATLSAQRTFTLLATGDVLTARTVNRKTLDFADFTWAWQKTADELRQADLTFINLETPLVSECPVKEGGFVFCGDQRHVQGLQFAGVDVVNAANNHMGNFGQEGVDQTVNVLETTGIKVAGIADHPIPVVSVKGQRLAFLGYNEVDIQTGVNASTVPLIKAQIAEAKSYADLVIVQFHWGNEYTYQPTSHQELLAQTAIESGADLIIGNHPHWWQPPAIVDGTFITYSHGNFIFDQMWSNETREGVVGKYTFYDSRLVDVEFLPVRIEDYGQPDWITGTEKQEILSKIYQQALILKQ